MIQIMYFQVPNHSKWAGMVVMPNLSGPDVVISATQPDQKLALQFARNKTKHLMLEILKGYIENRKIAYHKVGFPNRYEAVFKRLEQQLILEPGKTTFDRLCLLISMRANDLKYIAPSENSNSHKAWKHTLEQIIETAKFYTPEEVNRLNESYA